MKSRSLSLTAALLLVLGVPRVLPAAQDDSSLLASCYFRFLVAEQVLGQSDAMAKDLPADKAGQVKAGVGNWYKERLASLRAELDKGLGDQAEPQFEKFLNEFAQGEKKADAGLLARLSDSLKLKPAPGDYPAFRKAMMESVIAPDMSEASRFLGEVQTWAGLQGKDVPSLDAWLTRSGNVKSQSAAAARPKKAARSLADAEAATPDLPEAAANGSSSPLETFAAKRKEKRDRALSEAEAGMAQVASERQAAEEEYAARKLAAAQAEADNMRQHAEKLAATEKDALEQRKNSWGNRIKSIIGATVSATTGAFAGGIGARAGEEAVNAIFDHDRH